ncbi:MAG: methyltransferase domain-containing protein [Pseudomonadota bacterium]
MTAIHSEQLDGDALRRFVKRSGDMVAAGFNCAITVAGDRLGLYVALQQHGPVTPTELAEATGLHERWLREWLQHQACVKQVEYADDGRFFLSPEAAAVLVDSDHPAYLMGAFDSAVAVAPAVDKLQEAFRTGLGMSYDDHGASCACAVEKMGAFTKQHRLVPELIPLIEGLHEQLSAGIKVADVGCGGALSSIAMALRYPASEFVGYDISEHALDRARENIAEAGVSNVSVCNPLQQPLPATGEYEFVATFDVIHDTPYPAQLIADIHAALKPGGHWLCEDIRGFETFAENLREHPMAGMLYGFSVMVCMSAGLSTADGAGLGTLGFTEGVAREMTAAAGFASFRKLDVDNPLNNYYVLTR